MIKIVDYGMGNLRSVQKAFEKLGVEAGICSRPEQIERADKLVLPGRLPSPSCRKNRLTFNRNESPR